MNGTISYTHAMPMYIHMHCGIITFKVQLLLEWPLPMKEWNMVWLTICSPRHEFWSPWGPSVSVLSYSNISSNFFPGLFVQGRDILCGHKLTPWVQILNNPWECCFTAMYRGTISLDRQWLTVSVSSCHFFDDSSYSWALLNVPMI